MTEHILYLNECMNEIATGGKTTVDEHGFHHLNAAVDAMKRCEDLENRLFANMHREHRGDIPKEKLDEFIRLTKEYWKSDIDTEILDRRHNVALDLMSDSGPDWLFFQELVDSILARSGFKSDASNEDVYAVLAVLGWRVV